MTEWDQLTVGGRAVVHHPQGIALGHPSHSAFGLETLNGVGLTEVAWEQDSTFETLHMLVG